MKHLRAIDGLRAVAVLAVVAYHAGLPLPAGFVGVDVFFVISGYLITKLLHEEVQSNGRIDFWAFYARRARRILPALVVVVLATLAASTQVLSPADQQQTAKSAAAALLFVANIFFNASPTGYFDPSPHNLPLLHLWSLGVEEQFYLVWPLVLLVARKRPAVTLAVLAAVSLALAEWWLGHGSQSAFYQMPARAWELSLGGLVALRPVALPRGAAWTGLAIVLAACVVPFAHFPGIGALPAVIGSALLIAAIQNGERCPALEARPMVAVGLISYSLYLWHWPVLLLGKPLLFGVDQVPRTVLLVAVSFVCAALSYRFVETPVRRSRPWPIGDVLSSVTMIAACSAAVLLWSRAAFDKRDLEQPTLYSMECDDWYLSARVKPCTWGSENAKYTAVIIGDSVGLQWFPAISKVFERSDWRLVAITKSGCPIVDQPYFYARIGRLYTECSQWRERALRGIAAMNADVVIIGSTYNYGFSPDQWIHGTRSVLHEISPHAEAVRLLRPTPILSGTTEEGDMVYQSLEVAARPFDNVRVVSMNDLVCPHESCPQKIGGISVFRDNQHLSVPFAASMTSQLRTRLQIPLD